MSQPTGPRPRLDVRGAVDLSTLEPSRDARRRGARAGCPSPGAYVVDVDQATFPDLVQSSTRAPGGRRAVVAAERGQRHGRRRPGVARRRGRAAGGSWRASTPRRTRRSPRRSRRRACRRSSRCWRASRCRCSRAPTRGTRCARSSTRCSPPPRPTGSPAGPHRTTPTPTPTEPEPEPELPPLHQAAYDAIERDDLAAATRRVRAGAQGEPARRPRARRPGAGRTARPDARRSTCRRPARPRRRTPTDVDAQLAVADLDILGGKVEDAFGRLVDVLRTTFGPDRERVRVRLVDLFEVIGGDDPRVIAARRAMASALY